MTAEAMRGKMRPHKNRRSWLRRLRRDEQGVAAVEFGVFAPLLFFTALTAVDLGMAITERMTINHVLRAGADFAMTDPGPEAVDSILEATAKKNFKVDPSEPPDDKTTTANPDTIYIPPVDRYFVCSDDLATPVLNPSICTKDYYVFYDIRAKKTYKAMIMPKIISSITFNASIRVQVR